jgi:glycosyltransferase involved in cell wall biosynthesis
LIDAATMLTVFDQSSVEILRKAFKINDAKIKVIPHVIDYFNCNEQIDISGLLHIGLLGTLSHLKGSEVVNSLSQYIGVRNLKIPLTLVGSSLVMTHKGIKVYGSYEPNDLPSIISSKKINVILMASIVPETFSYTISETMKMGLPIVAFDIGAQGNRVNQYKLGKVVPFGSSPEVILSALQSVLKLAQEIEK